MSDTLPLVTIEQLHDYRFAVSFENTNGFCTDEAPPTGGGDGPSPSQLLAAAIGNCLAASLFFCLKKRMTAMEPLRATVSGRVERNAQGRLRIAGMTVVLDVSAADARCLDLFERYCTVTESVRNGIPVHVQVRDSEGTLLYDDANTP
ncbi:MAG: OsmC family protein [Gammaproteobacteria bacterium]|nr:OsmC family protein [Gammaproteobacteria bacterium]